MRSSRRSSRPLLTTGAGALVLAGLMAGGAAAIRSAKAAFPWFEKFHHHGPAPCPTCVPGVGEGAWYWIRSPEEERQAVMSLYARYCIRCHGVDGRGVWDIPGIPDFTNLCWQGSRPDAAVVRSILEGRGAVMPPFRGTLTLEEAWGMARYLRTFVPGTETPRPDFGRADNQPGQGGGTAASATSRPASPPTPTPSPQPPQPPPPPRDSRGAFTR